MTEDVRGQPRVIDADVQAAPGIVPVATQLRSRSQRTGAVIAIGLLLVGFYFALPGVESKDAVYSIVGIGAVACILASTRYQDSYSRLTAFTFAGAIACFVAGDGVANAYDVILHREPPTPSLADALYLAGYPLLIAAVARMSRATSAQQSRENRVDAGVVTIGALALTWQLLMSSYAHDGEISLVGKLVALAYPVMDIGVLFIVVNGLVFAGSRRAIDLLIAASMASMLVADLCYDVLVQRGTYATGDLLDAGWLVSYVLIAAAAFHGRGLSAVPPLDTERQTRRRLPVVALVGLIAPGILVVTSLTGQEADTALMAAGSIVIFGLIVVRLTWLLNRLGQQTNQLHQQAESLRAALELQQILEDDLRYQAFHDGLTGLPNRSLLNDRVNQALDGFPRSAGSVAVLFIDLDGFKAINDSLGHYVGDQLLVTVSRRLLSVIRPGDTVARLGGDEFAILLNDIDDSATGIAVADRAVSALRQPVEIAGQAITISASVGIAFADAGASTELILSQADVAMYDAKASGKDQVRRFLPAMRNRIVHRLGLRNAFNGALERGEFCLDFQPQLSLRDGTLNGFEALPRWAHPNYGELGPAEFIGLAEETGFIVPLGQWILDTACNAAATWPVRDGKHLSVSVNVSGRQLRRDHFLDDVNIALSYSGLRPADLVLEVAESIFLLNPAVTAVVLNRLAGVGVRLAVDGFGTGYATLSSLKDYPIDHLKIDRSFVALLRDPGSDGAALVQAIIRLAHQLGLSAVAEGVEVVDQHRTLVQLGCDAIQGYLLSRPLDPESARTFADTFADLPWLSADPGPTLEPSGRAHQPPVMQTSWVDDKGEETWA